MYSVIRGFVKICLGQFFSVIRTSGEPPLQSGPLVVVSNHPNCALDPLIIASSYPRDLWFISKSTVFKGKIRSWFLRQLHMIPIQRRQDAGSGGINNDQAFERVAEVLIKGGAVLIFPEGVSLGERKLFPAKTGAARMAFLAECMTNFNCSVKFQPIGLTYTELESFKSSITVKFGSPISVSDFKEMYQQDAVKAVDSLTEKLEAELRELTVTVNSNELQNLIEKIAGLYESAGIGEDDQARLKIAAREVESRALKDPKLKDYIQLRVEQYIDLLKLFNLSSLKPSSGLIQEYFILLNSPMICLGALTHYVPYKLIGEFIKKRDFHPATIASYKLAFGVLVFPIFYFVVALLGWILSSSLLVFILTLAVLLWSGYSVNNYLDEFKALLFSILWPSRKKPVETLRQLRDRLIADLEEIRNAPQAD